MLGKKMVSLRKLAKRVNKATKGSYSSSRTSCNTNTKSSSYKDYHYCPSQHQQYHESLLVNRDDQEEEAEFPRRCLSREDKTPTGFLAVYVGEERRRFVVPTGYLSHPLFRMLLDKARDEFGFDQQSGLAVPCSVQAFREVVSAVESCHGGFDFRDIVQEFL